MKVFGKHINNLLVAAAIFLVFGQVGRANEAYAETSKVAVISELQSENHGKPFVFDALTVGEVSQTISQNEYLGLGYIASFAVQNNFSFAQQNLVAENYYTSKDKRELIFKHIFPFHFFW